MNRTAPIPNPKREEVYRLANAVLCGDIPSDEAQRFEHLITHDPEACDWYVDFMSDAYNLHARSRLLCADQQLSPTAEECPGETGGSPWLVTDPSEIRNLKSQVSNLKFALPSPLLTHFSSGWPVAYLIATVIFTVGLVIGTIVHVSGPAQVVQQSDHNKASNPQSPIPNPSSVVARITGMVDCHWAGSGLPSSGTDRQVGHGRGAEGEGGLYSGSVSKSLSPPSPLVSLGDRLALHSGLLEITYDTGARVILQGPVTYDVESATGGYLAVGKLTAKLEKRSDVRSQKSESANQKSPDLCPLTSDIFAIRTPTAIVTDLGTEFGVEVGKDGNTKSHVFRGSVRFSPIAAGKENETNAVVLRENDSIQTQRPPDAPDGNVLLLRTSVDPRVFVRSVPPSRKSSIKTLDLSDIVAGGDGRLRRRQNASPASGVGDILLTSMAQHSNDSYFSSTDMIDRVFLPDGGQGAVRLDSARHSFGDFPKMVGKQSGSVMATPAGLIGLRPNVGITFDLKAMRNRYPGVRPGRLRANVFYGSATGTATLFRDDFQSDLSGTMPRDANRDLLPVIGDRDVGGNWVCTPATGSFLQVWNNVNPGHPANDPGDNNYVKVQRNSPGAGDDGRLWASGWMSDVTRTKQVELRFSLWKPSTSLSFAGIDAFTDQALNGRSFAVYFQPNGDVLYYDGDRVLDTGITYRTDAWQNVIIKANMATQTFSLTVEGSTVDNLHWNNGANVVNDILFTNGSAPEGRFFVDNVTLTATSGLTESQRLGFGNAGQGDFWVFVDGQLRFKRLGIRAEDAAVPLDIEIGPNDQFLTLVSTRSRHDIPADWIVWKNAVLDMDAIHEDEKLETKQELRPAGM